MNIKQVLGTTKTKYTQLLAVLLLVFIAYAFFSKIIIVDIIISLIILTAIITIIRIVYQYQKSFYLYVTVAGLAFIADVIDISFSRSHLQYPLALFADFTYAVFFFLAIVVLLHRIFSEKEVSLDTIIGGITVFILIGDFGFILYQTVYLFNPNAFSTSVNSFGLLYFSFTTLTTVGYGDISPAIPIAQVLANLEGIIGVMFPAIFIGRLVGVYNPEAKH